MVLFGQTMYLRIRKDDGSNSYMTYPPSQPAPRIYYPLQGSATGPQLQLAVTDTPPWLLTGDHTHPPSH
jgi:hypothetical protein